MKIKKLSTSKKFISGFLILGLIYYVFQFHSQKEKDLITTQILNDMNIKITNLSEFEDNIEFDSEYLKSFSLFDKPSVFCQLLISELKQQVGYRGRNNLKILNQNNVQSMFYLSISEPIISDNSELVIIKITTICKSLCGESIVYVFEKKDGKWRVKSQHLIWIS